MVGSFAALATLVAALTANEPIDLTVRLPENAVVELRMKKSERIDGGNWETTQTAYRIAIQPVDADTYRAVWTDLDDADVPPMIFQTDEALTPILLENQDALVDHFIQDFVRRNPDPLGRARLEASFRAMTAEELSALVASDFVLITYGQGTILDVGEATSYQEVGVGLAGSEPMVMNASFRLESVHEGTAVVVWTIEIDPVQARNAVAHVLAQTLTADTTSDGAALASTLASTHIEQRTECWYHIDVETGLSSSSECNATQSITIAGETRSKHTRLIATQVLLD